jgi:hypothetical protein
MQAGVVRVMYFLSGKEIFPSGNNELPVREKILSFEKRIVLSGNKIFSLGNDEISSAVHFPLFALFLNTPIHRKYPLASTCARLLYMGRGGTPVPVQECIFLKRVVSYVQSIVLRDCFAGLKAVATCTLCGPIFLIKGIK